MKSLDPLLAAQAARLLGGAVVSAVPVAGGYTHAGRWRLRLEDGRAAFLKHATDEATARWLRDEWRIYGGLRAPWLAEVRAWEDGERPVLLLEDLGAARWPPTWTPGDVERVLSTMAAVASAPPPAGLSRLADSRDALCGWSKVAQDPAPFLGLGLAEPAWLDRHLPALIAAEEAAPLDGERLLHRDLRSDNLCFDGARTLIVDWNWAQVGNPTFDIAFWLPSLWAEGGPPPWEVLPQEAALAALVSGFFAACAGLPTLPHAPRVRHIQRVQLERALPWVVRALELPPPAVRG